MFCPYVCSSQPVVTFGWRLINQLQTPTAVSDFACTYAQPSTLAASAEGNTLALAAYAEDSPDAGAACFFQGRRRDSWLAARRLIMLAKVLASRFVLQSVAGIGQFQLSTFNF